MEILSCRDIVCVFDASDPACFNTVVPVRLTDPQCDIRPNDTSYLYCVAISPDCTLIACGTQEPRGIPIFHVESGMIVMRLHGHMGRVLCLRFSDDGSLLLSGAGGGPKSKTSGREGRLWSLGSGRQLSEPWHHENEIYCCAFIPSRRNSNSSRTSSNHRNHRSREAAVEKSSTIRFASGGADFTNRIWMVIENNDANVEAKPTPIQLAVFHHRGVVMGVEVAWIPYSKEDGGSAGSPRLAVISGCADGTVRTFYETPSSVPQITAGSSSSTRDHHLDDDEKQCIAEASYSWREEGAPIVLSGAVQSMHVVNLPSTSASSLSSIATPHLVVACLEEGIVQLDLVTRKHSQRTVSPRDVLAWSVVANRDGSIICCGCPDKTVRVFNKFGKQLAPASAMAAHRGTVTSLCIGNDDRTLVSAGGSDGTLHIWRLCRGRQVAATRFPCNVAAVRISDDGCSYVVLDEKGVKRTFPLPLPALLDANVIVSLHDGADEREQPCLECGENRKLRDDAIKAADAAVQRVKELEAELQILKHQQGAASATVKNTSAVSEPSSDKQNQQQLQRSQADIFNAENSAEKPRCRAEPERLEMDDDADTLTAAATAAAAVANNETHRLDVNADTM